MMYCLRYFLLLLLLPFPQYPHYFVLLFLISLCLQHKPCIYCSFLLIGIFSSTCWLDIGSSSPCSSLSSAVSNSSTNISSSPSQERIQRCWFGSSSSLQEFFEFPPSANNASFSFNPSSSLSRNATYTSSSEHPPADDPVAQEQSSSIISQIPLVRLFKSTTRALMPSPPSESSQRPHSHSDAEDGRGMRGLRSRSWKERIPEEIEVSLRGVGFKVYLGLGW
ncbi:hypothetical protein BT69DRAFT_375451 [Atractiella rhizophila]|nr:hypothetical protein BT69DRAFT_375451 [Atractiella rhizophila]